MGGGWPPPVEFWTTPRLLEHISILTLLEHISILTAPPLPVFPVHQLHCSHGRRGGRSSGFPSEAASVDPPAALSPWVGAAGREIGWRCTTLRCEEPRRRRFEEVGPVI